ncbi:hypothetical protein [Paenibacillus sp. FJAT-26967]|uniref:hypothetical protein n=1 Tax=Paenibacillus sp. FJAT-26967 TaxID=1729690 RepID=UPI000838F192|nr:hypothetical protein [Paenibacillus sp. FJAT-26967]
MKKYILLCLFLITAAGCSQPSPPYSYAALDVSKVYTSFEEIAQASPIIAEVKITDNQETIHHLNADFAKTQIEIVTVFKGKQQLERTRLSLSELAALNITKDTHKGNYVLFLRPYEGPVAQDAYTIAGVYQGKFKVADNHQLMYDAEKYDGVNTFQKEFVKTMKTDKLGAKIEASASTGNLE